MFYMFNEKYINTQTAAPHSVSTYYLVITYYYLCANVAKTFVLPTSQACVSNTSLDVTRVPDLSTGSKSATH